MHQFDLDRAIASWRQFILSRQPYMDDTQRDELEAHVRDAFDDNVATGMEPRSAWEKARGSIGEYGRMESAYHQNFWRHKAKDGSLNGELRNRMSIVWNYFLLAFRSAKKRPLPTFLNVSGLSIGLAACLIIGIFVWHQSTFDRFHAESERIYRIGTDYRIDGDVIQSAATVGPLLPVVMESVAGIEKAVRVSMRDAELQRNERRLESNQVLFADSAFFDVFTFPLARGNAATALADPLGVVLSHESARFLFGTEDPVGQTILVDNTIEVRITGVLEPIPQRSHVQFDMLASTAALQMMESWIFENWFSFYFYSYVTLTPNTDAVEVAGAITQVARDRAHPELIRRDPGYSLALEPLESVYLASTRLDQPGVTGNPGLLRIMVGIGLLILFIATVNYVNMATALSLGRSREIGIRKVVGADRGQLSRQFLTESFLTVSVALGAGLLIASITLPKIGDVIGVNLTLGSIEPRVLVFLCLGLILVTALIAGWYPARMMSRIPAAPVLSGSLPGGVSKGQFRRLAVVLQFSISFILIAATLIVDKQLGFIQTYDNGYREDGLIALDLSGDQQLGSNPERVRSEMLAIPGIRAATLSSAVPGDQPLGDWNMRFESPGGDQVNTSFPHLLVDQHFLDTYEIPIVAGRSFRQDIGADDTRALILNETAVKELGFENPEDAIGIRYDAFPDGGEVIGVAADFHFTSLRNNVGGIAMRYMADRFGMLTVRAESAQLASLLPRMESVWNDLRADKVFNAELMDEVVMQQYEQDRRFARFFSVSALVAIVIALMGLFGQISYSLRQRSKEIGIRRVLGAETSGLTFLLSREVVILTLMAAVVGAPLTWLAMSKWLDQFAVHTVVGPMELVIATLVTMGVAFLTILGSTLRAAHLNPVDVLRRD